MPVPVAFRPSHLGAILALTLTVALASCGGGSDHDATTKDRTQSPPATTTVPGTASGGGSSTPACRAIKRIADEGKAYAKQLAAGPKDWPSVRDNVVDAGHDVVEAEDQAIPKLDADLAGAVTAMRDFTRDSVALAPTSDSLTDFSTSVAKLPNAAKGFSAALKVNSYAEKNCGFSAVDD